MIKLNTSMRDGIVRRLIRHRFLAEYNALIKERAVLAHRFWLDRYTKKERDLMDSLPEGWLDTTCNIEVNCAGQREVFHLNGLIHDYSWIRQEKLEHVFVRVPGNNDKKSYPADHPLAVAREKLNNKLAEFKAAVQSCVKMATTTCNRATTANSLVKLWPEIEPFVPTEETAVQLPALPLNQLNDMFKLPAKMLKPEKASA